MHRNNCCVLLCDVFVIWIWNHIWLWFPLIFKLNGVEAGRGRRRGSSPPRKKDTEWARIWTSFTFSQHGWVWLPYPSYSDIMPHYIGAQRKYFTVVAGHSHNIINSNIMAGLSGMRPTFFLFCFKMTNATFTTFTWRDVSNDRGPYLRIHDSRLQLFLWDFSPYGSHRRPSDVPYTRQSAWNTSEKGGDETCL